MPVKAGICYIRDDSRLRGNVISSDRLDQTIAIIRHLQSEQIGISPLSKSAANRSNPPDTSPKAQKDDIAPRSCPEIRRSAGGSDGTLGPDGNPMIRVVQGRAVQTDPVVENIHIA